MLIISSLLLILSFLGLTQDCPHCSSETPIPSISSSTLFPELIKIKKIELEKNSSASFCRRPVEMIDTIVIHHSLTSSTTSAERINDLHLERGTPSDPWYMMGYSYTINSPYPGGSIPKPIVTEGRPLEIVGAHAGSQAFVPMDEEQQKLWDEKKIVCGKENSEFKVDPKMVEDKKIKANVTTIGVVIIGNYEPFSRNNPSGFNPQRERLPSPKTLDMTARLSCQLQKQHPRIKNIKWHSFYNQTNCPGTIKRYINQIRTLTRKYGCEFY
jgi:hypothetical protein